jgi:hypothetical protein
MWVNGSQKGTFDRFDSFNVPSETRLFLASATYQWHLAFMPHHPPHKKKPQPQPGELENRQFRSAQLHDQRRQQMATRSTLARLRNRKSDLK